MPDFVIVGGGVYGCGVAWQLAQRGAEVLLLEAQTIASGASGGLGKRGVRANGRDIRELPLMRLAYELWTSLDTEIGASTGYERTGHLLLMEREQDYGSAAARVWTQNQQGIPTRLIERDELQAMEPYISKEVIAAIYCPLDGVADHTATTIGLAQAAKKQGVSIQEHTTVVGIERVGSRVTALLTDSEERIAVSHTVLLLSNSHVASFVEKHLGITLPIWQCLPQVMLTQPVAEVPVFHLIGHAHRTLAIKRVPHNQIMISGGWRGRWNYERNCSETIPTQVEGNRAEAVSVYPHLANVEIVQVGVNRWETVSVDKIPIIDRLPGASNMIVATGWSGHGWAIAPAIYQLLAQWAYTGKYPDLLLPFSYTRFQSPLP